MGLKDNNSANKNKNYQQSFYHAFVGIKDLVKTERNFRFHLKAGLGVILLGIILRAHFFDWLWIFLSIGLVISAEIINTLFERVCDLIVSKHYNLNVKKIKDMAAANVVIVAILAIIIGSIIFIPLIIQMILSWR